MNIDLMRSIDLYVGRPLTRISTWILRCIWLFRSRPVQPANRVLLIELSEMGSAILVDPAMRDIRRRGGELFFAIFAKNKPSLDLLGTVPQPHIFCIRDQSLLALAIDSLRFLWWTRHHRIDAVIDLELFSRFTALLTGWSGASRRIGFYRFHNEGLYRGEMLSHRVAYNPHVHISKNFLSLVHALYAPTTETPWSKQVFDAPSLAKCQPDPATMNQVAAIISDYTAVPVDQLPHTPLVLVNANASDMLPQRRWPQQRFAELIGMLLADNARLRILLTGSPAERPGLETLAQQLQDSRCVNFAGAVQFLQLPALYQQSALMITNDSGPAHFAAITDMPTIVLFGPETPDLYRSLGDTTTVYAGLQCSPCVSAWNHRKTACNDNQCLKSISAQQVFALAKARLRQFANPIARG